MDRFVGWQVKLAETEKYVAHWRRDGLILIWESLKPATLALVLAVVFVLTARVGSLRPLAFALILPVGLVVVIWASVVIVQWYVRIFVLTSRRLIRREGIITRKRLEVQLPKVQNTSYAAIMVEKWLGLGRVTVETASVGLPLVIDKVRHAPDIAQRILAEAEAAKAEIAMLDERQVRQRLSERLTKKM